MSISKIRHDGYVYVRRIDVMYSMDTWIQQLEHYKLPRLQELKEEISELVNWMDKESDAKEIGRG